MGNSLGTSRCWMRIRRPAIARATHCTLLLLLLLNLKRKTL
jgi:hypothetical protein